MSYVGVRTFHDVHGKGFIEDLFGSYERFYVYVCPICSKIEFFVTEQADGDSEQGSSFHCLQCKQLISYDDTACSECGWTWHVQ